ncbi:HAMP domain-containing protein [Paenibacillus sp. CGMCC 1.16610]|uniref:histidine kinase n=1 Tax=Paenibacillus anseongense TaxID=2682845 RepID=A0ABW9UDH4_9BACL|nr:MULTISPECIES: HAMP domain-containing sensor histidine kinase [Paenibacillus]MBA2942736.1 HAMP domain-containing protein [Paenibacillus sp. CGMCC 1.16610]MVQ38222.1 HAMP domain-containing protein [Paenibacillus anseongense]
MKRKGRFADLFVTGSLKFQLLSRTLLVLSVLLLLIGVFQYVVMQRFMYQNKAETIRNQLAALPPNMLRLGMGAGDGQTPVFPSNRENRPGFAGEQERIFVSELSIAFIDEKGNYKLISSPYEQPAPQLSQEEYLSLQAKKKTKLEHRIVKDEKGNDQLVVFHQIGGEPERSRGGPGGPGFQGIIQASTSVAPIRDVLVQQLLTFIFLSLLAMVFGLLGFLPVLRRTLVPLSKMVDTVKQIDAGNLNERFPAHQGQVEIDRLATSFNGMLERLEISFEAEKEAKEQMRRFAADASHELRTPLTSIHGFLEVLLRGAYQQPEPLLKALKSMHGESVRINKLVEDLLMLARLDRSPSFQKMEGVLDEMLHEMEPQLRLLAGDRKVTFHLAPQTRYLYDPDKIKQVVLNLFHNAVQHTHPLTGEVGLTLAQTPSGVEIAIHDNGEGIAPEHLPHLFDRFYRIDTSRTRRNGGAGLGLSITHSIVQLHGGLIEVHSIVGVGTTFKVILPAEK